MQMLFQDLNLGNEINRAKDATIKAVKEIDLEFLERQPLEALIANILPEHWLRVPTIREAEISRSPVDPDKGTLTIFIPTDGDVGLLKFSPHAYHGRSIVAEASGNELRISVSVGTFNLDEANRNVEASLAQIRQLVSALGQDIQAHEVGIRKTVAETIAARKTRIAEVKNLDQQLKYELRR